VRDRAVVLHYIFSYTLQSNTRNLLENCPYELLKKVGIDNPIKNHLQFIISLETKKLALLCRVYIVKFIAKLLF